MKSSYELTMERLGKQSPALKLTARQKQELAELDSKFAAKLAEREIALKGEVERLLDSGKLEEVETAQKQLVIERKALQAELEEKKGKVRSKTGAHKE